MDDQDMPESIQPTSSSGPSVARPMSDLAFSALLRKVSESIYALKRADEAFYEIHNKLDSQARRFKETSDRLGMATYGLAQQEEWSQLVSELNALNSARKAALDVRAAAKVKYDAAHKEAVQVKEASERARPELKLPAVPYTAPEDLRRVKTWWAFVTGEAKAKPGTYKGKAGARVAPGPGPASSSSKEAYAPAAASTITISTSSSPPALHQAGRSVIPKKTGFVPSTTTKSSRMGGGASGVNPPASIPSKPARITPEEEQARKELTALLSDKDRTKSSIGVYDESLRLLASDMEKEQSVLVKAKSTIQEAVLQDSVDPTHIATLASDMKRIQNNISSMETRKRDIAQKREETRTALHDVRKKIADLESKIKTTDWAALSNMPPLEEDDTVEAAPASRSLPSSSSMNSKRRADDAAGSEPASKRTLLTVSMQASPPVPLPAFLLPPNYSTPIQYTISALYSGYQEYKKFDRKDAVAVLPLRNLLRHHDEEHMGAFDFEYFMSKLIPGVGKSNTDAMQQKGAVSLITEMYIVAQLLMSHSRSFDVLYKFVQTYHDILELCMALYMVRFLSDSKDKGIEPTMSVILTLLRFPVTSTVSALSIQRFADKIEDSFSDKIHFEACLKWLNDAIHANFVDLAEVDHEYDVLAESANVSDKPRSGDVLVFNRADEGAQERLLSKAYAPKRALLFYACMSSWQMKLMLEKSVNLKSHRAVQWRSQLRKLERDDSVYREDEDDVDDFVNLDVMHLLEGAMNGRVLREDDTSSAKTDQVATRNKADADRWSAEKINTAVKNALDRIATEPRQELSLVMKNVGAMMTATHCIACVADRYLLCENFLKPIDVDDLSDNEEDKIEADESDIVDMLESLFARASSIVNSKKRDETWVVAADMFVYTVQKVLSYSIDAADRDRLIAVLDRLTYKHKLSVSNVKTIAADKRWKYRLQSYSSASLLQRIVDVAERIKRASTETMDLLKTKDKGVNRPEYAVAHDAAEKAVATQNRIKAQLVQANAVKTEGVVVKTEASSSEAVQRMGTADVISTLAGELHTLSRVIRDTRVKLMLQGVQNVPKGSQKPYYGIGADLTLDSDDDADEDRPEESSKPATGPGKQTKPELEYDNLNGTGKIFRKEDDAAAEELAFYAESDKEQEKLIKKILSRYIKIVERLYNMKQQGEFERLFGYSPDSDSDQPPLGQSLFYERVELAVPELRPVEEKERQRASSVAADPSSGEEDEDTEEEDDGDDGDEDDNEATENEDELLQPAASSSPHANHEPSMAYRQHLNVRFKFKSPEPSVDAQKKGGTQGRFDRKALESMSEEQLWRVFDHCVSISRAD